MNVQTQSHSSLPGLAPTEHLVTAPTSVVPVPASISTANDVRPSSLGLVDEFEQEAA